MCPSLVVCPGEFLRSQRISDGFFYLEVQALLGGLDQDNAGVTVVAVCDQCDRRIFLLIH